MKLHSFPEGDGDDEFKLGLRDAVFKGLPN
jgi:hypothetical protein